MVLQILFIDFTQALDSLKRNEKMIDAKYLVIHSKLIRLITKIFKRLTSAVRNRSSRGVRQGGGLSATLFIIVMEGFV